jgi:hypothetical protein
MTRISEIHDQAIYGSIGRYEDFSPNLEFRYRMAGEERYRGGKFVDARGDLRRNIVGGFVFISR